MDACAAAPRLLEQEARALLARIENLKPFALQDTMLLAAAPTPAAYRGIERLLADARARQRHAVRDFLRWLGGPGRAAPPEEAQRRFGLVRLAFNDVITQYDLFADVMTQRSEAETGVLLAGLDVFAADALRLPGGYFSPPPVVCYLDRGPGAAIRRARTRLPGGVENPVAVVRVPRERMIGVYGLGTSLVHEVGHQAAALLELVASLREPLRRAAARAPAFHQPAWVLWQRWISEIVADLWAVARIGITATLGLIGVVSMPTWVVWRVGLDDPHPIPWVRVRLSCAMGGALYPHAQWEQLAALWECLYPRAPLRRGRRVLIESLEASMPAFVEVLAEHRSAALRGRSVREAVTEEERHPERLTERYRAWLADPRLLRAAAPSLVFAVLGKARHADALSAGTEEALLRRLLERWALGATVPPRPARARVTTDPLVLTT
jgi:hypothetical protein